ncbi:hypothetical protein [Congregibacter litoralis]|uniref:Uncharacterized protein n=1 Tax=Congregibacter litoralis KT71 TaxID=314285 RepID=A4AC91_9GAMM|nr:hypothetical protein [Congregibacter litoralis]EAQ96319.1 hypothetical protein KT71_13070 [Congregibacter litoralis KT71]
MILAKFANAVRGHDWFTALIELILLVMGIFFGFQLDRWNDERLDRETVSEYRSQLINDLEVERSDITALIAYHESVRDYSELALTAWDEEPQAGPEELVVALYQASNVLPFTSARGAYDALSANGLIDLIGDLGLRSRLASYYGQGTDRFFEEEKRYRREVRGVMPIQVQRRVLDTCVVLSTDNAISETFSSECNLELEPEYLSEVLESIRQHPRLLYYLREGISRDSVFIYLMNAKFESPPVC